MKLTIHGFYSQKSGALVRNTISTTMEQQVYIGSLHNEDKKCLKVSDQLQRKP